MTELLLVTAVLSAAVAYALWRVSLTVGQKSDPCSGCSGCDLKDIKQQCEAKKDYEKFGCSK